MTDTQTSRPAAPRRGGLDSRDLTAPRHTVDAFISDHPHFHEMRLRRKRQATLLRESNFSLGKGSALPVIWSPEEESRSVRIYRT